MDMLLTPAELRKLLRISKATYIRYHARGFFRFCESDRPLGHRKFIKARLEEWTAGGAQPFHRKRSA